MISRHATENNCTTVKGGRCFFSRTSSDDASRFRAGWNGLKRLIGLAQLFFLHAMILWYGFYKTGWSFAPVEKRAWIPPKFQRPF
jgi:hypothetical protein